MLTVKMVKAWGPRKPGEVVEVDDVRGEKLLADGWAVLATDKIAPLEGWMADNAKAEDAAYVGPKGDDAA